MITASKFLFCENKKKNALSINNSKSETTVNFHCVLIYYPEACWLLPCKVAHLILTTNNNYFHITDVSQVSTEPTKWGVFW